MAINGPPWVQGYFSASAQTMMGLPDDSLVAREQLFATNASAQGFSRVATLMGGSLVYGMRGRTSGQWPVHDTASADRRIAMVSHLAIGDTAGFRRLLAAFDSMLVSLPEAADGGAALASAEAHLILGDSGVALERLRFFRDNTWARTSMSDQVAQGIATAGMLWPRTFLLLGDLAAARGQRDAAEAYRRFIGLWSNGEPSVQPTVQRARDALARLGS